MITTQRKIDLLYLKDCYLQLLKHYHFFYKKYKDPDYLENIKEIKIILEKMKDEERALNKF